MSSRRINQNASERCLLTDIVPYETPMLFSNWGSYYYQHRMCKKAHSPLLSTLLTSKDKDYSIPYAFRIKKDFRSSRTLHLIHPKHSRQIANFYSAFDTMILAACRKSRFSLRTPHHVAKFYTIGKGHDRLEAGVEDITAETAYASSYFAYSRFSHLHKFFDSDDFTELEKRFSQILHADVVKCFPSIYTHSISWAVRGKSLAKRQRDHKTSGFDRTFDRLLQNVNYQETNGIVIGPELCRIFAEIIFQKIDVAILSSLKQKGYFFGVDYQCCRFIDDYFFFFNKPEAQNVFLSTLKEELEKYKLYINEAKLASSGRPFITPISTQKLRISEYINTLFGWGEEKGKQETLRAAKAHKEINKLRSLIAGSNVPFSSVSTFFLSSLEKRIRDASSRPMDYEALYVYIELAFHAFRMDIRVPTSFRIASIVLYILGKVEEMESHYRHKLSDKLAFELRGAVESAIAEGCSVECMNLLIASTELLDRNPISPALIDQAIDRFGSDQDEASHRKRLSYFEIVSLLYVIKDCNAYSKQQRILLEDAAYVLKKCNPLIYAESAFLLLDLVCCPYLHTKEKDSLISSLKSHVPELASPEIGYFRNSVSRQTWFFNWNKNGNLRSHLKKKELMLAY